MISNEDSRNIMHEDLIGLSVSEIISSTERKGSFFEKCTHCNKKTVHEQFEKLLMLPEVLIVSLKSLKNPIQIESLAKTVQKLSHQKF